jgi:hypothetical protein
VLAGVLLVASWSGVEPDRLAWTALDAATTSLSRSFLVWAARGQSLVAVHDLVEAAMVRDLRRVDDLVARVRAVGDSSGTALLLGIGLATAAEPAGSGQRSPRGSRPDAVKLARS